MEQKVQAPQAPGLPLGDLKALRDSLTAVVCRVCPRWLRSEREDLIQTALIKIWERVRSSEREAIRSPSYLWRVAYNVTVDEIRRRDRAPEEVGEGPALEHEAVAAPGPEQRLRGGELGRAILECLSGLVTPRRRLVTLYLYGLTPAEIQRSTGWAKKRVENLVFRGLGDLRACLSQKGLEP